MFAALSLAVPSAYADAGDLEDLSLEELINLKVTTASRRSQRAGDVAAAVFVITQDDIRRSGARSIPEALRLAPGLQVAQIDASRWAISARGFNSRFANKLLVLMDGRTLYTPSFSGTHWDAQDTIIEDIERIEVIRGAASTVWGTNAVNGIINIITKRAAQTSGFLASADQAIDGSGTVSLRYGEADRADFEWRLYGKLATRDGNELMRGGESADDADQKRLGARAEWQLSASDAAHLVIEGYDGKAGFTTPDRLSADIVHPHVESIDGTWVVAGWNRAFANDSRLELQTYLDHFERSSVVFGERRETADIDLQFVSPRLGSHLLTTGANVRYTRDRFDPGSVVNLIPASDHAWLGSLYLQDEIGFLEDRVRFTAGARLERAQGEPTALLPNLRLQWSVTPAFMTWAAVARGERRPGRAERDLRVDTGATSPGFAGNLLPIPASIVITGNPRFESERLLSNEIGARWQVDEILSFDLALFENRYRQLRGANIQSLSCEPAGVSPLLDPSCIATASSLSVLTQLDNSGKGRVRGAELLARLAPTSAWRLTAQYSRVDKRLEYPDLSFLINKAYLVGTDPRNQFAVRSALSLGPRWDWDVSLRSLDGVAGVVAGYTELGTRISWQAAQNLEMSLIGSNLLQRAHFEAGSELGDFERVQIERAVMLQARWSWR
jgi:iron complex outermembrane receptor protein